MLIAWLLENVLPVTVSMALPKLSMAPPTLPPKKVHRAGTLQGLVARECAGDDLGGAQIQEATAEDIEPGVGGTPGC